MSQGTFEQALTIIQSLPPEDIARLREILEAPTAEERRIEAARALAHAASLRDYSAERQWLADHRDEYAWQWVALKGEQLISHGTNGREVHAAAKAAGHPDALLVQVEPSDARSFIL